MTRRRAICMTAMVVAIMSARASGHHAFTPVYDEARTVTITGTVTEFKLINPHARISLDVVDKGGRHAPWLVEMAGLLSLARHGWTEKTVAVGQRVTVTGNPTHTGSRQLFFTRLTLPDGRQLRAPGRGDQGAIDAERQERARRRSQPK